MNKEEIIKYCLTLENTYKDCPFPDDFESVTMKHLKNKKWFALIMSVKANKLYLNVETDPNYSDILRNTYDYIIPAYHMNKEHWNTIIIDEKVDEDFSKRIDRTKLSIDKVKINTNSNLYNKEGVFGRTMEKIINNKRISILKFIFLISLLYYICWIIWSIYLFFHGID